MKGPPSLLSAENSWETRMGKSFPGERVVYRGKDLFHDLKDLTWMQLYLYGITGRHFTKQQAKLFEGMWKLSTSYPEAFLWNNRVGSLSASQRSTGALAIGAAIAVSEAGIYGGLPIIRAIDFLTRTKLKLDQGMNLQAIVEEELEKFRGIPGYGRPIANKDERIAPLLSLASELNMAEGRYTQLAFAVEKILLHGRRRMCMNVAALAGALAADQGLSKREYYLFAIPCFLAGITPCFLEANEHPEGTFLPISCKRINYSGSQPRKWSPSDT